MFDTIFIRGLLYTTTLVRRTSGVVHNNTCPENKCCCVQRRTEKIYSFSSYKQCCQRFSTKHINYVSCWIWESSSIVCYSEAINMSEFEAWVRLHEKSTWKTKNDNFLPFKFLIVWQSTWRNFCTHKRHEIAWLATIFQGFFNEKVKLADRQSRRISP